MSGYDSRKRKRRMRRESKKEEVRRCIEVFADFITNTDGIDMFPHAEYNRLTWKKIISRE
ncbi:MAG: hypothetical protein RTU92_08320 [Candidatus Thorarchaeota archaeon]